MRPQLPNWRALEELATQQHGVVGRRQLLEIGLGPRSIGRMIETARLHPIHRGVYAVGHRILGPHGRWMAAVLACGEDATLSHRSAAEAWGILPRFANDRTRTAQGAIHVTVPGDGGRAKSGIASHRNRLAPADASLLGAIRITTPSRTLIDLAATARTDRYLERAPDEARYRGLLDVNELDAAIGRAHRGVARLRRVLQGHVPGSTRTRSGLEEAFLALLRSAGLPQPLCNQRIGGMTVDFLWPTHRLVVEVDGGRYHDTLSRRRTDARRDAALHRRGHRVLRIAEAEIRSDPGAVATLISAALADLSAG